MEYQKKQGWSGVTVISTQKIWQNFKHLWWICLVFFVGYGSLLGMNVWKTYQSDLQAVKQDTYQASIQIYYPHETEEEAEAFIILGESSRVIGALNEALQEEGYRAYGEGIGDHIHIQRVGSSYGTTVLAEGEERSQFMAQRFGEIMVDSAEEVMGKRGGLMGDAVTSPCVVRSNGNTVVFDSAEAKTIQFSLRDFVSWKKIMLLFATILLGVAVIFVVILFDKKVRAREEMETAFSLPCIAVVKRKKADSMALFSTIVQALCHKNGIHKLMIAAAEKDEGLEHLKAGLAVTEEYSVETAESALESAMAVQACAGADGVILVVRLNRDKLDRVGQAITNLDLVSAHLLGYVLID